MNILDLASEMKSHNLHQWIPQEADNVLLRRISGILKLNRMLFNLDKQQQQ